MHGEKGRDEGGGDGKGGARKGRAGLEAERVKVEQAARAYEDLEERERHFETATAEFEARTKALDQREKKLKDEVAGIARERTETKAIWKNLEAERERVSRKEATIESLGERTLEKERESLVGEKEKVRAAAAD